MAYTVPDPPMPDAELNAWAHTIAYESATSAIECNCHLFDEDADYYDVECPLNNPAAAVAIAEAVRYLDARGLIERHPERLNWIILRDECEATR